MKASKIYWDARYSSGGDSGYGSYDIQLIKKLNWLKDLPVESISEFGCGDFNFGRNLMRLYPRASYAGLDISDVILNKNKERYPYQLFISSENELPPADLVLCIDVLFHVLEEEEVEEILGKLEKIFTKYLAITAYERNEEKDNHVRIRKFDYSRFGTPIVREIVEEDGDLYFYLFKK